MENKVEELMKPRYKVIADYPDSPFKIGDIIYGGQKENEGAVFFVIGKISRWPHLFKKLEWWEDRKPEEMPEYVKTTNTVKKVYRFVGDKIYFTEQKFRSAKRYTPATESEYLEYKSKQP